MTPPKHPRESVGSPAAVSARRDILPSNPDLPRVPRKSRAKDSRNHPHDGGPETSRPVLTCRLKVTFPPTSWLYRLTTGHPECWIDVLDRFPLSAGLVATEAKLHGDQDHELSHEIERTPDVRHVETLEQGRSATLVRVVHRTPKGIALFRKLRITRQFPFRVENGRTTWLVVTTEEKLRHLLDGLSKVVSRLELESVRTGPPDVGPRVLTERQNALFREAMRQGYFDVPRRTSLTRLAGRLGLSKSSLSKTLAIVEMKLLTSINQ